MAGVTLVVHDAYFAQPTPRILLASGPFSFNEDYNVSAVIGNPGLHRAEDLGWGGGGDGDGGLTEPPNMFNLIGG